MSDNLSESMARNKIQPSFEQRSKAKSKQLERLKALVEAVGDEIELTKAIVKQYGYSSKRSFAAALTTYINRHGLAFRVTMQRLDLGYRRGRPGLWKLIKT